jgi:hypothetical protein
MPKILDHVLCSGNSDAVWKHISPAVSLSPPQANCAWNREFSKRSLTRVGTTALQAHD